jgi:hypothetical protein
MNNKKTNVIALILLSLLFFVSLITAGLNSLTFDEKAHIPAGYSYLEYQDYRVNPEHPPLAKSIPALPLVFQEYQFPFESENWQQKNEAPRWWVQFDLGDEFLYQSDNNPREMILWSRLFMILMLVFLGWFLFNWAREIGGNKTALMTLFLFSFSPTMIAHGQLVTTDVGAALGVVLATRFWLRFLKNPIPKNIVLASLFLALGLLFKFSLVLLIPFLGLITLIYTLINFPKKTLKYLVLSLVIGSIAVTAVIWPVYAWHNWNQPIEQQIRDTQADLKDNPIPPVRDLVYRMTETQHLRHLAQYFRGLLMATQRTGWGNNVYFLGEMSAKGWWYYFPVIFLLKEPLALHLLSLFLLMAFLYLLVKKRKPILGMIKNNFTLFSFFVFILIYWAAALIGNLNIGIRHLIPTLPFLYLILAEGMRRLMIKRRKLVFFFSACFFWYGLSSILAFPHYLPYYNELAGGSEVGYLHAVDSNYDWGQDFYRLMEFIEENEVDSIYLDYFGGENPSYWLGDKYKPLDPRKIESLDQTEGWLAVSVNHLMGGLGRPVPEFDQETGYYYWLANEKPMARAGKSIMIYYID